MDRILTLKIKLQQGFTLLEVMVALAILAIALTSVYRLQAQTYMMSTSARFYCMAPQLARAKLSEIERQSFKDIADGTGDFGEDYPGYNWSLTVEDVPTDLINDEKHHLTVINLTVTLNDEDSYHLRTYRYFVDE